jgi:HlyD family secretion protein
MSKARSRFLRSISRHVIIGLFLFAALVFGIGGWATTTELSGAVIAPGSLVVESNVKKVQHPTGGVVGELRVREGARVSAGDVVVRLDETIMRANLAIVRKNLIELTARQARLDAERDGANTIAFPEELAARSDDPDATRVIAGEASLFELRQRARAGQKAQLREQTAQLREQIQGFSGQAAAKRREINFIQQELEGVRDLWRKNLIPIQRLTALERDSARLEGESEQLVAAQAQARGKISEIELQIIQIDQDLRSEVAKELREVQAKLSEFIERQVAAEDQLKRIDIRAPQDGRVHQLNIHTVGGVAGPGETLMLIVPESDSLLVEVKVAPNDIDQVRPGQRATVRFAAFNQRTTPELNGEVHLVSADITLDPKTGTTFYTVRVALPQDEIARLQGLKLVPGMPLETFIQTDRRTALSYLLKPVSEQIERAWRER